MAGAPNHISVLLTQAVTAHRAGNLDAADRLYDKVLKIDRNNTDALNLKGLVAAARGTHAQALAFYDRGLKAAPGLADLHANRGNALSALGRDDEALHAYRQAVRLKPGHLEAWLNAGTLFHRAGRFKEAVAIFQAAAAPCPDVRIFFNLGLSLRDLAAQPDENRKDRLDEAAAAFARAVAANPAFAPAHISYSAALSETGAYDKAIVHLQSAIALKASAGDQERRELLSNLGELFRKNGQLELAVATQRQALALGPQDRIIRYNLALSLAANGETAEAERIYLGLIETDPTFLKPYINLSNIYRDQNRTDAAVALCERALAFDSALAEAYTNIGANFADLGWLFPAVLLHHKALSLKPADPESGLNFAVNLLRLGRFNEGWPYYDCRFGTFHPPNRATPPKQWEGEDVSGKSVLIWTEQGVGDEILYASMIGDMAARSGRCVIECSKRLVPVFARSFPGMKVAGWETSYVPASPTGDIDVQIAAGSLGRYLRPDFASFPRSRSFLKAEPTLAARLRDSYKAAARGRRIVGLAWRSKNDQIGASKSAALINLAPILKTPGIFFVNLQYGDCDTELAEVRETLGIEIFQDPAVDAIKDIDAAFAQTAAMDLVVTSSNSAAHIAGAQGVPVWIMLPHAKGVLWYWFAHREDSPWYPSARLFRAAADTDQKSWESDLAPRVALALSRPGDGR
ncbi:MAG: tetratricopeptide repeat protein [Rhodospirillaceae bacterium]